jgi:hypothetical protein
MFKGVKFKTKQIENFEQDCLNIISQLNTLFDQNNCSKKILYEKIKKNNDDDITDENKSLIYNMFRKDFDYFNYQK